MGQLFADCAREWYFYYTNPWLSAEIPTLLRRILEHKTIQTQNVFLLSSHASHFLTYYKT